MNAGNLDTTNLLLGIMAAVSVLEALLLIGIGVMAYRLYTSGLQTMRELEARQVAPLAARANDLITRLDAILVDVKEVTTRVSNRTERVDSAIRNTTSSVSSRVNRLVTLVHTARAAVDGFLHNRRAPPNHVPRTTNDEPRTSNHEPQKGGNHNGGQL
jgi:hypothetical protein